MVLWLCLCTHDCARSRSEREINPFCFTLGSNLKIRRNPGGRTFTRICLHACRGKLVAFLSTTSHGDCGERLVAILPRRGYSSTMYVVAGQSSLSGPMPGTLSSIHGRSSTSARAPRVTPASGLAAQRSPRARSRPKIIYFSAEPEVRARVPGRAMPMAARLNPFPFPNSPFSILEPPVHAPIFSSHPSQAL
jgi:hypothetical protein